MGRTILCVDDEHHGLMIRRLLLEKAGYSVLVAESAHDALALFSRGSVDAVVLDYYLPDVDGGKVAAVMRMINPEVPIILFSAQWHLPEEAIAIADAFLGKGQHPSCLLDTLQDLIFGGAARRAQSA